MKSTNLPDVSHTHLFKWATEFSKCKDEEAILSHIDSILNFNVPCYRKLAQWSNSSYMKKNFPGPISFCSSHIQTAISAPNIQTPISAPLPGNLPLPEMPTVDETSFDETSHAEISYAETSHAVSTQTSLDVEPVEEPDEEPAGPSNSGKRKRDGPPNFTYVKNLLKTTAHSSKYRIIPISTTLNGIPALYADIKLQLAKCSNSVIETKHARYIIASHLLKLTPVGQGNKMIQASYDNIEKELKISKR